MILSRRGLIGGAGLLTLGCAARRVPSLGSAAIPAPRLAPVNVSADRVIRVITGLRPFRPSGFVVRGEKIDQKLVIHNYGHGGAGITLSWGTAQLAVDEAANVETRECAVIGCGVVGLSTARLLQQRGYNPVIYTKEMPPATTSNVAGGYWDPVTVFDRTAISPAFKQQFTEAARIAFRRYQSLAGDQYGVRWLPTYSLSTQGPRTAPSPDSPYSEVDPLYPEPRQLTGAANPFRVPYAYRRYSMLIEPAIYLNALLRDFQIAGGRVVVREFAGARELMSLRETLIFNCSGLGSRAIFNDQELVPIKGQLVFLLPQPEVDYMTLGPSNIYMFPRHDGILLGGTHDRGEWNLAPDPAVTARILQENQALFSGLR
jgi:glycine/D-amino acid oxidase-like deaminating enzyme